MVSIDSLVSQLKEGNDVKVVFQEGTQRRKTKAISTEVIKYFTVKNDVRYTKVPKGPAPRSVTGTVIREYDADADYFIIHTEGDTSRGPIHTEYMPIVIEPSAIKELINYTQLLDTYQKTDQERIQEKFLTEQNVWAGSPRHKWNR